MTLPPSRYHRVRSADGTGLVVVDHGPEHAPPIVLVHGWSQCGQSWDRQLPLAGAHRLIVPDLRGHGASDKPDSAKAYNRSEPWADDIRAIIAHLDLTAPLLVGWSMGGLVVLDYLRVHGGDAVSGVALVGSGVTTGRFAPEKARAERAADSAIVADGMYGEDLRANLDATLAFVQACFHRQPAPEDLARMVGINMLVPPAIRSAARLRHEDHRATAAAFAKPALVLAGRHDRAARPSMVDEAHAAFPDARRADLDDCGHAPFWEDSDRFNRALARFAAHALSDLPAKRSVHVP